jgi:hypothetical protein
MMRAAFLLVLIACITMFNGGLVSAISSQDLQSIDGDSEYYWPAQPQCTTGNTNTAGTVTTLVGSDNEQQAFNFFVQKGLSAIQAAGFVGNLIGESGVRPNADEDKGTATSPTPNDGFGIVQWTTATRQKNLVAYAAQLNLPVTDLAVQLGFAWQEFTTAYPADYQLLKNATNTTAAVNAVMAHYEAPQYPAIDLPIRVNDANDVISLYGGSTGNSGTTVTNTSDVTASNACTTSTGSAVTCTSSSTTATAATTSSSSTLSSTRQNVVCLAEQELATWKAQPDYSATYPGFTYAATGFLKYSDNNYEEWCADFISWIYNQAGDPFTGGLSGGWRIAGVSSVQDLGTKDSSKFTYHPESSGYVPQPGDIAIHTNGEDHVNIFISSTGGQSEYIGGDQGGNKTPSGAYGSKNPPSGSVVSVDTGSGYYSEGITGYVSPN